jgi:3-deoxy-7-phosphoheptulonate synthase
VQAAGANILRGGAFKPRTSPYNFQGLGMRGLELLAEARSRTGLPVVTEIMDPHLIEPMYPLVDAFQVGARNMQNFDLLRALGDADRPVVVKRAPSATVEEWLLAAEYVLSGGNERVILCERGIRTFNNTTRYTLDLASVALVKRETHLPVIVDPSHATGDPVLVGPCALAALAVGADGVMVEVHDDPKLALSDGQQALTIDAFARLMDSLRAMAPSTGRAVRAPVHALRA